MCLVLISSRLMCLETGTQSLFILGQILCQWDCGIDQVWRENKDDNNIPASSVAIWQNGLMDILTPFNSTPFLSPATRTRTAASETRLTGTITFILRFACLVGAVLVCFFAAFCALACCFWCWRIYIGAELVGWGGSWGLWGWRGGIGGEWLGSSSKGSGVVWGWDNVFGRAGRITNRVIV